jgi:hypothetical protein
MGYNLVSAELLNTMQVEAADLMVLRQRRAALEAAEHRVLPPDQMASQALQTPAAEAEAEEQVTPLDQMAALALC